MFRSELREKRRAGQDSARSGANGRAAYTLNRTQEVGGWNLACVLGCGPDHRDKCRMSASDPAVTRNHRWDPCLPRALED